MPKYFYKAKNLQGKEESGTLNAKDKRHLAGILHRKGYFLLSAEAEGETEEREKEKFEISIFDFLKKFRRISLTDKLFFTRNLEVMIKTGVPLPRAFRILSAQIKSEKFKKALIGISEKIVKGENLSSAMSFFPDIFPELYQETLKVGEETGKLEYSLRVLSNQMEREHDLKSQIKTAMIYPTMVLCVTLIIGVLMMIFVVPNLKVAFEELGVELPFTTQIVLSLADFLSEKFPIALLIIAGLVFGSVLALRSKKGGKIKSKLSLKIPIISKIIRQVNSALTLRTLSSLLKSGVPIVRSLEIISGALTNFYFKKSLKEAAELIEKGQKLSQILKPYADLYSPMVLQMIKVGEETGETSEVLEKLAEFYEEETRNATQKLSSFIEPILILFVGGIVGFFVISMMQPMFSIMGGM